MLTKVITASALSLLSTISYSADWSITPSISPKVEYDDNVQLSPTNKQSSISYKAQPTLQASIDSETWNIDLSSGYSLSRYNSISRLNQTNPFFKITNSITSERANFGISFDYKKDAARNSAVEDTGNFSTNSVITSRSISPNISYQLTERDSLSISSSYTERTYSTSEFNDNLNKSLNLSWQRQYTERLGGSFLTSYSNYKSGDKNFGSENDSYSLRFGMSYDLSEKWSLSSSLGFYYVDSIEFNAGQSSSSSNTSPSFDLSASYQSLLSSIVVSSSRSTSPSSDGNINEQEQLSLSWNRRVTETVSMAISASYNKSTSALDESDQKRENIGLSPRINWQYSPQASISLSYSFRQQKSSTEDKAESNAIYVGFNYDFDSYSIF